MKNSFRHLMFAFFVAVFFIPYAVHAQEHDGFTFKNGIKFGMTVEQVAALEKIDISNMKTNTHGNLYDSLLKSPYAVSLGIIDEYELFYGFKQNQLTYIKYEYTFGQAFSPSETVEAFLTDRLAVGVYLDRMDDYFNITEIHDIMKEKYGAPAFTNVDDYSGGKNFNWLVKYSNTTKGVSINVMNTHEKPGSNYLTGIIIEYTEYDYSHEIAEEIEREQEHLDTLNAI